MRRVEAFMDRFNVHAERLPNFLKVFGLLRGVGAYCRTHFAPWRGQMFSLTLNGRKVWLRRTASDTAIFFQIFVKREYETAQWRQHKSLADHYDALLAAGRTPIIIDAGANIGLSALWFSARYPKAKIYAIEPDDANMAMLMRNIAGNPNIIPIRGAVWDKPARLKIGNPQAGAGGVRVEEGEGPLQAYS